MTGRTGTVVSHDAPLVLHLDGGYEDYELERGLLAAGGLRLVVASPAAHTEADVLACPDLGRALVLTVELAPVTAAVLGAASACRAVVRYGTGLDNIDLEAATAVGITVHNVADYAADSVADHVLALLLTVLRNVFPAVETVRAGAWRDDPRIDRPTGLRGQTLGLLGCGAIGAAVARRAQAFGLTVLVHDPYLDLAAAPPGVRLCAWDEVLAASDVLSLHAPLTPATRGILGADALRRLKPTAVVVNTARGGLVDEDALIAALDSGRLRGAALDVTAVEPPPPDSPLRGHPGILLTPHIGFWSDQSERALRTGVARAVLDAVSVHMRR